MIVTVNHLLRKLKHPLLTSFQTMKVKSVYNESELPEFTYAGKNIKPHKRVYVMGVAAHGALGVKEFLRPVKGKKVYKYMHHPHRLEFADIFDIEDIACGYGYSVFAVKNNKYSTTQYFYGTGITTNCQIGHHGTRETLETLIRPTGISVPLSKPSKSKKVACGRAHTLVWTDADGLWSFGNNSYGQCGRPVLEQEIYGSKAKYHHVSMFECKPVDQLECGQDTSFVLSDGKVFSCGLSADGQTGTGTYHNVEQFRAVEGDLKGERIVKLSCKSDCALALSENGEMFGWGNSEYRQLGSAIHNEQTNTPRKINIQLDGKIIDVAASGTCSFAVTDCGSVWSWGFGSLGVGPNCQNSIEPKLIPSTLLGRNVLNPDTKITKIFAGVSTAAALTDNGGLYAWGRNLGGCLGLGHRKFQHFPQRVCVASKVLKVSCGYDHSAILAESLM